MQHEFEFEIVQIGDAAAMLNMTPSGVRWLIDTGKLPAQRTPGGQRIPLRKDVERLAAERAAARDAHAHVA